MRVWIIVGIGLAAIVTVLFLPPIPQDPAYHDFADRRPFLGIPNALNVLSNAPFVLVGALGLAFVRRRAALEERTGLLILFAGVGLTGFGSAYYHLAPGNVTLFWDRLPMTIVIMSLFAVIIAERISLPAGRRLLPLLRPPAPPLRAPPPPPPQDGGRADLLGALAWYALAKLFEALDAQIFAVGGVVSGHTLKHLASAVAMYWILRMVRTRRAIRW